MIHFSKEQIFVVTGASSGIGEGVALFLNKLGATVVGIGRNQERLDALKTKAENSNTMFLENKDLAADIAALPAYVKELKERYGKLGGMVFCAGLGSLKGLQMINLEESKQLFEINYFVPIFMAKGFADRRNNTGKGASMVFIASAAAEFAEKGQIIYAGTKSAIVASAKAISHEVSVQGIRCNCISPAFVETPMYKQTEGSVGTDLDAYPLGIGRPEDIAKMAAFLLSAEARWITGQNMTLDGGRY